MVRSESLQGCNFPVYAAQIKAVRKPLNGVPGRGRAQRITKQIAAF